MPPATDLQTSGTYEEDKSTLPRDLNQTLLHKLPVTETAHLGKPEWEQIFDIKAHDGSAGQWNVHRQVSVGPFDRLARAIKDYDLSQNGIWDSTVFGKARLQMVLSFVLGDKKRNEEKANREHSLSTSPSFYHSLNFEVDKAVTLVGNRSRQRTLFKSHCDYALSSGNESYPVFVVDVNRFYNRDLERCMAMISHSRRAAGLQAQTIYGLRFAAPDWYFVRLYDGFKFSYTILSERNKDMEKIICLLGEIIDYAASLPSEG